MADNFHLLDEYKPSSNTSDPFSLLDSYTPSAPKPEGGFTSSLANVGGSTLAGAGQVLKDVGVNSLGDSALRTGKAIQDANQPAVQGFSDIVDHPGKYIAESAGQMAGQAGVALAGGLAGRAIGTGLGALTGPLAPVAVPVLGAAGAYLGGNLPMLAQEYGGERQQQAQKGIDDKGRALTGAVATTAIENLGGFKPGGMGNLAKNAVDSLAGKTFGEGAKVVGKEMLKSGLAEGAEEIPQQYTGAYGAGTDIKDLGTAENLQEGLFGAAMAFPGGALFGAGNTLAQGPLSKAAAKAPVVNPAQTVVNEQQNEESVNEAQQSNVSPVSTEQEQASGQPYQQATGEGGLDGLINATGNTIPTGQEEGNRSETGVGGGREGSGRVSGDAGPGAAASEVELTPRELFNQRLTEKRKAEAGKGVTHDESIHAAIVSQILHGNSTYNEALKHQTPSSTKTTQPNTNDHVTTDIPDTGQPNAAGLAASDAIRPADHPGATEYDNADGVSAPGEAGTGNAGQLSADSNDLPDEYKKYQSKITKTSAQDGVDFSSLSDAKDSKGSPTGWKEFVSGDYVGIVNPSTKEVYAYQHDAKSGTDLARAKVVMGNLAADLHSNPLDKLPQGELEYRTVYKKTDDSSALSTPSDEDATPIKGQLNEPENNTEAPQNIKNDSAEKTVAVESQAQPAENKAGDILLQSSNEKPDGVLAKPTLSYSADEDATPIKQDIKNEKTPTGIQQVPPQNSNDSGVRENQIGAAEVPSAPAIQSSNKIPVEKNLKPTLSNQNKPFKTETSAKANVQENKTQQKTKTANGEAAQSQNAMQRTNTSSRLLGGLGESVEGELKPTLSNQNKPFKTAKSAEIALKSKGYPNIGEATHHVVPVEGGFGHAVKAKRKGEVGGKLEAGEVVTTASGRDTTPFPKFQTGAGKTNMGHFRSVDSWLIHNAHEEARARGDEFNARQFAQDLNSKNIPPASKDTAEEYLFGQQPNVIAPITRPLINQQAANDQTQAPKASTVLPNRRANTGRDETPATGGAVESDVPDAEKEEVSEQTLIDHGLLQKPYRGDERWLYKIHPESGFRTANSKERAVDQAREAFNKIPPDKRLTTAQKRDIFNAEYDAKLEAKYGGKSIAELERMLDDMSGSIASHQRSGNGEVENGYRSTSKAVSNEAARGLGEEKMKLEGYIRDRKAKQPSQPSPSKVTGEKQGEAAPENKTLLDAHKDIDKRLEAGDMTAEELKAEFQKLVDNKDAVYAELNKLTKADLTKMYRVGYQRPDAKKSDVVKDAYQGMLADFKIADGLISYGYTFGQKQDGVEDGFTSAVRKFVNDTTDADIKAYAEQIATAKTEREAKKAEALKGMDNPKTLEDYQRLMRAKMDADKLGFPEARMTLTPEQRETYDSLAAEKTRGDRKDRADQQKTSVSAAAQSMTGDIVETKHTKTGEDLFVVKTAERVDKDVYKQWNTTAKRMGGYYSSFRGAGAVPGFQFKTRDNAEAFLQYLGGDVTQAKEAIASRRDAYADDKSQTAAERLNEMADRLDDKADEELSRERKTNTHKRAGEAARAEAAAEANKAMAATMRNIAGAIESGEAQFLDRVRQKVQVELLQSVVHNAQYDKIRKLYPAYIDQQKHEGERPDKETADYVEYPHYTAYRSDLATLGRALLETDGTKKLGQQIMSVADDVSDAYLKFAKENLHKVSTFTIKGGAELAAFKTKTDAEKAIAHSGFNGKAIVLPVKRNENLIILSPSEAIKRGVWQGDNDKRLGLSREFGKELVEKIGKAARKGAKISVPWQFENAYDKQKRLTAMGIETPAELRAAIREFISLREAPKEADKIKQMERAMIGRQNDGLDFFPTPAGVADEMIEAADIQDGMKVLEPSAGMGHIAERIREAGVEPDVVEMSNSRKELLEAKGFNVVGRDFMEVTDGGYDRIIMNPPFGDRRDALHVQHAYDLLNPGGRLVTIMGEGVFFGQDKKAQEFRDWLEARNGTDEKLAEGTFNDPSLPVNTGVNARMVVIDKPEGEGPRFSKSIPTSGSTADDIKKLLPKRVNKLVDAGILRIVQSVEDLPAHLQDRGSALESRIKPTKYTQAKIASLIDGFIKEIGSTSSLSKEQKGIYDVITDTKIRSEIRKSDLEHVKEFVNLSQGHERFGKTHILLDHFSGKKGYITANEILDLGKVVRDGKLDIAGQKHIYTLNSGGVRFKVVVSAKGNKESIITFYSNRKTTNGIAAGHNALLDTKSKATPLASAINIDFNSGEIKKSSNMSGVEALYDEKRDQLYLVSDMLNKNNLSSVLSHELLHRSESKDPLVKAAIDRFEAQLQRSFDRAAKGIGSAIELAAYKRVMAAETPVKDQASEYRAYMVSQWEAKPDSFTGLLKKTFADLVATIRAFLVRNGIDLGYIESLTPADLTALSKYGAAVNGTGTGSGILKSFAGQNAKTADTYQLSSAQQRIEAGDNPETVRQETGWFKGVDGKWRFEIDDSDAKLIADAPDFERMKEIHGDWIDVDNFLKKYRNTQEAKSIRVRNTLYAERITDDLPRLRDVIEHPALFSAYPELGDTKVAIFNSKEIGTAGYNQENNIIVMSPMSGSQFLNVLLHEIQHGIQYIEGFATGGNSNQFKDKDITDELRRPLDKKILGLMDANPEFGNLVRKKNRDFIKIQDTYGKDTPRGRALNWDDVPNDQTESYFDLLDKLSEFPENQEYIDLEQDRRNILSRENTLTAHEQYKRLAGEVEARNTQARQKLTAEQRKATPPIATADIQDSDVIVVFNGKEMANAPTPRNADKWQGNAYDYEALGGDKTGLSKDAKNKNRPKTERWYGNAYDYEAKGGDKVGVKYSKSSDDADLSKRYTSKSDIAEEFKKQTGDNIFAAENVLAGIAMRNNFRDHGNLNDAYEESPYTAGQMDLIDLYNAFGKKSPYLFHTTRIENISSIKKHGLVTDSKRRYEGVSGDGRISFAANEQLSKYYGSSNDAMLRVKKNYVFDDLESDLLGGDGTYTTKTNVPAAALEIKVGRKWVSLSEFNPESSDIRYSKSMADLASDAINAVTPEEAKQHIETAFSRTASGAKAQSFGLLTLRQIADVTSKVLPNIQKVFIKNIHAMDTEKNKRLSAAGEIATEWAKLPEAISNEMSDLMHDSTIAGVDGSKAYVPVIDIPTALAKIQMLNKRMIGMPGEPKEKMMQERKELYMMIGFEKKRKLAYPEIKDRFNALAKKSPEAVKIYNDSRDHHEQHFNDTLEALKERIGESKASPEVKKNLIAQLRLKFESLQAQAPYFPLARFGDYWVHSQEGDETRFNMFESEKEQEDFIKQMGKEGVTVLGHGKQLENLSEIDGVSAEFITEVDSLISSLGDTPMVNDLRDSVYQLYLNSLPDVSARKHFIHRKKTKGFHQDQLRAFAKKALHDANSLAKLKYGYKLQATLDESKEAIDIASSTVKRDKTTLLLAWIDEYLNADLSLADISNRIGKTTDEDELAMLIQFKKWKNGYSKAALDDLYRHTENVLALSEHIQRDDRTFAVNALDELRKSYKDIMNPKTNPLAQRLNSIGFAWYLGLTPAASLINITQTPVIALPILASKVGWGNASKAMLEVSKLFFKNAKLGKNGKLPWVEGLSIKDKLQGNELKAYDSWVESGLLDVTLAHDLAGLSDEGILTNTGKHKLMNVLSFGFHHAERMNREITALAAYRSAIGKGMNHNDAVEFASKLVLDSHFDYTSSNRARFMRGNVARVVTQFKQYSQNLTYLYARTIQQAYGNSSPEEKAEARKALKGLLIMQSSIAGTLGLPMVGVMMGIAQALSDAFGDDDEPEDIEGSYRQLLADLVAEITGSTEAGNKFSLIMSKGLIDGLTPFSVSGRLSASDLWVRSSDQELEGTDRAWDWAKTLLGPMAGLLLENPAVAMSMMADGHYERGIEHMMPKAIKDGMKALRFSTEGVENLRGDSIKEDYSIIEGVGQILGFSSSEISDIYDQNNAIKRVQTKMSDRRQSLLNEAAQAKMEGDSEGYQSAMDDIKAFNGKNPNHKITGTNILQSIQGRKRRSKDTENGLYVSKRNRDIAEKYQFAK